MRILVLVDEAREKVAINADQIEAVWCNEYGCASLYMNSGRVIPICEDRDSVIKKMRALK
jgi:hypothetical protein